MRGHTAGGHAHVVDGYSTEAGTGDCLKNLGRNWIGTGLAFEMEMTPVGVHFCQPGHELWVSGLELTSKNATSRKVQERTWISFFFFLSFRRFILAWTVMMELISHTSLVYSFIFCNLVFQSFLFFISFFSFVLILKFLFQSWRLSLHSIPLFSILLSFFVLLGPLPRFLFPGLFCIPTPCSSPLFRSRMAKRQYFQKIFVSVYVSGKMMHWWHGILFYCNWYWQHGKWGLCEYVKVHTILGGSPVILWISLGGKPKLRPLKFGHHDVMRTSPIDLLDLQKGQSLYSIQNCTE